MNFLLSALLLFSSAFLIARERLIVPNTREDLSDNERAPRLEGALIAARGSDLNGICKAFFGPSFLAIEDTLQTRSSVGCNRFCSSGLEMVQVDANGFVNPEEQTQRGEFLWQLTCRQDKEDWKGKRDALMRKGEERKQRLSAQARALLDGNSTKLNEDTLVRLLGILEEGPAKATKQDVEFLAQHSEQFFLLRFLAFCKAFAQSIDRDDPKSFTTSLAVFSFTLVKGYRDAEAIAKESIDQKRHQIAEWILAGDSGFYNGSPIRVALLERAQKSGSIRQTFPQLDCAYELLIKAVNRIFQPHLLPQEESHRAQGVQTLSAYLHKVDGYGASNFGELAIRLAIILQHPDQYRLPELRATIKENLENFMASFDLDLEVVKGRIALFTECPEKQNDYLDAIHQVFNPEEI